MVVDGFSFWLSRRNFFQAGGGGQNLLLCNLPLLWNQNFERRGQKFLHLSRGVLRNITDVKWRSVGSTMTSTVGEITQTYSYLSAAVASEHIDAVVTHNWIT